MSKEKFTQLSWEDFQSMGNPENVPDHEESFTDAVDLSAPIRIYLERKGRKGKTVTLIKGFDASDEYLEDLARKLKYSSGVGGSLSNGQIILQGDVRKRTMDFLIKVGHKNVKTAGS
jgi:translation initiation factor 1